MKLILTSLIIAVVTYMTREIGPWWLGAIIVLIAVFAIKLKPVAGLVAGLLGISIVWGVSAGWIDMQNHSLLSHRIGQLFGSLSPIGLILITALIGGLIGALSGLTGGYLTNWLENLKARILERG